MFKKRIFLLSFETNICNVAVILTNVFKFKFIFILGRKTNTYLVINSISTILYMSLITNTVYIPFLPDYYIKLAIIVSVLQFLHTRTDRGYCENKLFTSICPACPISGQTSSLELSKNEIVVEGPSPGREWRNIRPTADPLNTGWNVATGTVQELTWQVTGRSNT